MLTQKGMIEKSLNGIRLTREEARFIMELPEDRVVELVENVFAVRKKYKGIQVGIQLLSNARSGNCSQNCAYCAQSAESKAAIDKYRLAPLEKLMADRQAVQEKQLARHCIGLSGIQFQDEEIEEFASYVEELKKQADTPICCSIGFLTENQGRRLKAAGVDRINHNLNTSRQNYPNICTTHTYDQRITNIRMLQGLGFEICCGGILGMGEDADGVIDMLLDIREISPQAVPINFLIPIAGTKLERRNVSGLTPEYCLKILSLARLLLPECDIRCAAGREVYLKGYEALLFRVVDSIFASGYLTTDGQAVEDTIELVTAMGFEYFLES